MAETSKALPIPRIVSLQSDNPGNNGLSLWQWPRQCPKMSNNVWPLWHKNRQMRRRGRPNSWKWWNFRKKSLCHHPIIHSHKNQPSLDISSSPNIGTIWHKRSLGKSFLQATQNLKIWEFGRTGIGRVQIRKCIALQIIRPNVMPGCYKWDRIVVNAGVWPNNVAKILKGESKLTITIKVGVFS